MFFECKYLREVSFSVESEKWNQSCVQLIRGNCEFPYSILTKFLPRKSCNDCLLDWMRLVENENILKISKLSCWKSDITLTTCYDLSHRLLNHIKNLQPGWKSYVAFTNFHCFYVASVSSSLSLSIWKGI